MTEGAHEPKFLGEEKLEWNSGLLTKLANITKSANVDYVIASLSLNLSPLQKVNN